MFTEAAKGFSVEGRLSIVGLRHRRYVDTEIAAPCLVYHLPPFSVMDREMHYFRADRYNVVFARRELDAGRPVYQRRCPVLPSRTPSMSGERRGRNVGFQMFLQPIRQYRGTEFLKVPIRNLTCLFAWWSARQRLV